MSTREPDIPTSVKPRAPKIIRTLNRPIAYSLTAVAMFGMLGLGLGTFSVDYEFAAMLLRVTVEILLGVGVLWAVPVVVWAVRAHRHGRLPPPPLVDCTAGHCRPAHPAGPVVAPVSDHAGLRRVPALDGSGDHLHPLQHSSRRPGGRSMTATTTAEDRTGFWSGMVELARDTPVGFTWFTGQVIAAASITTYAAWTATIAVFEAPGVERILPAHFAAAVAVAAAVGLWTILYVTEVVDAIHGLPRRWKANRLGGLALRPRLALAGAVGLMTVILAGVVLFWFAAVAMPDFADHVALDTQWLVYPGEGVQGIGMLTIPDGTLHTFLSPSTTATLTTLALAAGGWAARQCFEMATPYPK